MKIEKIELIEEKLLVTIEGFENYKFGFDVNKIVDKADLMANLIIIPSLFAICFITSGSRGFRLIKIPSLSLIISQ